VPLAVLAFGLDETGILFVLVMGSAFAVAIALRDGLRSISPIYQRAGRMLGAKGLSLLRHVMLPASLPALASSLRQGFSFAWRSLMGAELIFMVQKQGVGYLLHQGREFSDVAQVLAMMVVMISVGVLVDRWGFAVLERKVHTRFGLLAAR
jgi:NitT/TauT family transport system permease protein